MGRNVDQDGGMLGLPAVSLAPDQSFALHEEVGKVSGHEKRPPAVDGPRKVEVVRVDLRQAPFADSYKRENKLKLGSGVGIAQFTLPARIRFSAFPIISVSILMVLPRFNTARSVMRA